MPTKPKPKQWKAGLDLHFFREVPQKYTPGVLDELVTLADVSEPEKADQLRADVFKALDHYEFARHWQNQPNEAQKQAALDNIKTNLERLLKQISLVREAAGNLDDHSWSLLISLGGLGPFTPFDGLGPFDPAMLRGLGPFGPAGKTVTPLSQDLDRIESTAREAIAQVDRARRWIGPSRKGGIRRDAEYAVVEQLAIAYTKAKGQRPTRQYDVENEEHKRGPFMIWAQAVLDPLDVSVSDAMVKRAISAITHGNGTG